MHCNCRVNVRCHWSFTLTYYAMLKRNEYSIAASKNKGKKTNKNGIINYCEFYFIMFIHKMAKVHHTINPWIVDSGVYQIIK